MEFVALFVNCAIWFGIGWYFRGQREVEKQGQQLRAMFAILEAQADHDAGHDG